MVPEPLVLAPRITVDPAALAWSASRASGPGGQHVNTTDSRVTLRLPLAALRGGDAGFPARLRALAGSRLNDDDVLVLHCDDSRSQARNRERCLERLRDLIARAAQRPKRRRPTRPTREAQERRLQAKARRSDKKARRRGAGREEPGA